MRLYKYFEDCGRMGCLEGLFVMTDDQASRILGKSFYWSEVLGKHSEGYFNMSLTNVSIVDTPEGFVKTLLEVVGSDLGGDICVKSLLEQLDEMEDEE